MRKDRDMDIHTDVVIVGTGVSGLFTALNLPRDKRILMITKSDFESSDSFLAQGGICVLRDEEDYDSYFEDTMRAGHYENRAESVEIMIKSSREVIGQLVELGVEFERKNGEFAYTREGAHSRPRVLFHEDITGEEITKKLLAQVKALPNVTMWEYTTMTDWLVEDGVCRGIVAECAQGISGISIKDGTAVRGEGTVNIRAADTVLASGGIGGKYRHSTNFPHLTGDALDLAKKYDVRLEHLDYVQIHPTTFYSEKPGRRFLISESVRGEGAVLYNKEKKRFVDELLPRDQVTASIYKQMEEDGTEYVWLSMEAIPRESIIRHFPHIYEYCLAEGYDVTRECIPVTPAQHYFMGGIWVDSYSRTSMAHLYAAGETSCNGVHGANRLASNSLLESLVFAKRAAKIIGGGP